MDAPCGFPIVTQMRSSSSFEMPIQYEVEQKKHYTNGSNSCSLDDERSGELKKEIHSEEFVRVPIRDSRLKASSGQGVGEDCLCLAAEEISHEQNLAVIMTVRYYDEIHREMRCSKTQDEDRSIGQVLGEHDKILIRTTVTTVASISIHVSSPHKPFQSSNYDSGMKFHRIVLSATNFTNEVENFIGGDDSNLNVRLDEKRNAADCHPSPYFNEYTFPDIQPQIIISSNGKHIACLIPRPIRLDPKENPACEKSEGAKAKGGDDKATTIPIGIPGSRFLSKVSIKKASKISTVVILNLEPPTMEPPLQDRDHVTMDSMEDIAAEKYVDRLPLPQYLQMNESNDEEGESHHQPGQENRSSSFLEEFSDTRILPITTNDRTVTMNPILTDATKELSNLLSQITCIVDLNHNQPEQESKHGIPRKGKNAPMLLAGCNDGSIIMIAYKRAMALGIVYQRYIPLTTIDSPPKSSTASDAGRERHDAGLCVLRYTIDDSFYSSSECFEGQASELRINGAIRGKLLGIQRDGSLVMFDTEFHDGCCNLNSGEVDTDKRFSRTLSWESKTYSFRLTLKPKTKLHGSMSNMYANGCFIDSNTIAILVKPLTFQHTGRSLQFQNVIAQVWSVDPRHSGSKLIAKLSLDNEKLEGMQHGTFCFPGIRRDSVSSTMSSTLPLQSHIEYDSITGSLSISSAIPLVRSTRSNGVFAKLFVSLWDWRTCTVGFSSMSDDKIYFTNQGTLLHGQHGIMSVAQVVTSRHYFSRVNGINALVHIYSKFMRYKKDIYNVGVLSPSQSKCHVRDGEASNPIFLTRDQVMYPGALEVTTNKEIKIQWKQSIIPVSYAKKYGPITMASISEKFGRSLIVVGSKGFCILDIHKRDVMKCSSDDSPYTQLPTSCAEGFECYVNNTFPKSNINRWRMFQRSNENKFRVLAFTWWEGMNGKNEDGIVAVVEYLDEKDSGLYLVAWSTRSLKVGNLIVGFDDECDSRKGIQEGIRLSDTFVPRKASILVQPNSSSSQQRAVLLLVGNRSLHTYQTLIQLQAQTSTENYNVNRIISRIACEGRISSVSINTCNIFLASCNFKNILNSEEVEDRPIATIGVIEDNGLALSAVKIFQNTEVKKITVVDFWKKSSSSHRITHFWQDDFAPYTNEEEKIPEINVWTWTFLKTSGDIFTWAIGADENIKTEEHNLHFALHRSINPTACGNANERDGHVRGMFTYGTISDESKSVKASNSDESTLLVGTLPITGHRHLLFTGQQIYRNEVSAYSPTELFTKYGLSKFDIGIPCSTGSILLSLSLVAKYRLTGDNDMAEKLFVQICRYIRGLNYSEASCAILRTIASYLTQLVSKKNISVPNIECERKLFLKTVQSTLARIATSVLTQAQFVSLFFNVGRQLEPHHFKSLFPIIYDEGDSRQELNIRDCFDIAVENGSFSVPSAALPLFTNKEDAHSLSINLLHHCVTQVLHVCNSKSVDLRCLREECQSVYQLYSYLMKLEESETNTILQVSTEEYSASERTYDSTSDTHEDLFPEEEFSIINSTGSSYDKFRHEKVTTSPKISKIASIFIKPFSRFHSKKNHKEDEILEAATSFIKSTCNMDDIHSVDSEDSQISVSDSQSEASVLSEKGEINEYFGNQERTSFSALGILGLAITSTLFLVDDFSPDILSLGLRSIGTLCLLLCNNEDSTFDFVTTMDGISTLLSNLSNDDLIISLEALEDWHSERKHSTTTELFDESFNLSTFMKLLLVQSSQEWNDHVAFAVMKVITSILEKQNEAPEIGILSPLLCIVLAIAFNVTSHSSLFPSLLEGRAISDFLSYLKSS